MKQAVLAEAKIFTNLFRLAKANPNLSIASRFSGMTVAIT
jgi:hypothetical protein